MTDLKKYEMHGAPTTTVDPPESSIEPRDVSTEPTPAAASPDAPTPAAAPSPNSVTPTGPVAPQPPKAPAAPQPSMHARIFDKILSGMTGGDIKVVNPDGTVSSYAPSKSNLGKSIVAAALTGLMTPSQYRQGPYGPVRDSEATGAGAFAAGRQTMTDARQAPQKLSDEMQSRKLQTIKNNFDLMQLGLASAHAKHDDMERQQKDASIYLSGLHQYDTERPDDPSVPKAILYEGMTHEEAMDRAKQEGTQLTEANFIPDGNWKPGVDEHGNREMEPTYAVLNPALDKIKLTPEVAAKLSKVYTQYDNIHDKVGGDVNLPQNMWVGAWHDYSNLQRVNSALTRLNQVLHPDDKKDIDLSSTVRGNRMLVPQLGKIVTALAAGNGAGDGENPANILDVVLKNAPDFLKSLGMTTEQATDKVTDLTADRAAAMARAKNSGTAKEEADPNTINGLKVAAATLPADQQKTVMPTLQQDVISKREAEKVQADIASYQKNNQNIASRQALAGGSPEEIAKFAHNVLRGDLSQIDKLPTRGDARIRAMNAVHDEAARLGLDTTKYTDSYLKTKADMQNDYAQRKGKSTGAQLASFDAFLGHVGGSLDALDALKDKTIGLTRQPWVNQAMDAVGKQVTDSKEWKRWETSLSPVRNEISNFLAAGYSPKEDEQKSINTILDKHETPARIAAAIGQLAETADVRLASLGRGYTQTMDNNYPELLSADALNSMKRAGIKSKAAAFSGPLPKGWDQQGGFQNVTDVALAKRFVAAGGGDRQRAIDLARANGWLLQ